MHKNGKEVGAMLLMASVMIARGSSFVFSKWLMDDFAPMNILAVRFDIAFIILAIIFHKKLLKTDGATFKKGAVLGFFYTVCMVAEMYSLRLIDAGTNSFIENSAIVIVPLYLAIFMRKKPASKTVVCALIAFVGVGFLTITGGVHFNIGIALAILSAFIFGVCIIITDVVTRNGDPVTMGVLQIGFMGLFSTVITFCIDEPRLPANDVEWSMILLLAVVCSCFGFTFQPLAQKYLSAETAGIFTAINPLATCMIGVILQEEELNIYKLIGGVLIIFAVLLSLQKSSQKI